MAADVPLFHKDKHVSYWLRCLRTPLPTAYTSNDANRMMLSCFTLSALDLLGVLFTRTTPSERQEYADWIYKCQHPDGGFRAFPGTDFEQSRTEANSVWDPANLPGTFFALSALCVLDDDLQNVDRTGCLRLINHLQRQDGGFGELKGADGEVVGGGDPRFSYMATGIRWILRGQREGSVENVPDINVSNLLTYIRNSKTRDGAFAAETYHEAHAGLTFCTIATLCFLGNTNGLSPSAASETDTTRSPRGSTAYEDLRAMVLGSAETIQWITSRLTTELDEDEIEPIAGVSSTVGETSTLPPTSHDPSFVKVQSKPINRKNAGKIGLSATAFLAEREKPVNWIGFGGRCNKIADTCYAFWAGASLKMLDGLEFVDLEHIRCYLLEKTQHLIVGGFGKLPGDLPDLFHAYLGLAALSVIDGRKADGACIGPEIEDDSKSVEGRLSEAESFKAKIETDRMIRALDPVLCMSTRARRRIESFDWRVRI